jgi:prophage regulatory protein
MSSPTLPRRILRLPEVIKRTGLQRDSIYRGGREGWFPTRVKLTERASGWVESEVEAYIERIAAQRGKPKDNSVRPL